jgi:tripartite-type tricarboxylate transporter receptor subunit TctC
MTLGPFATSSPHAHLRLLRHLRLALAIGLASVATLAAAQHRIIVNYPPGGGLDATARLIADKLSEHTGRSYVVENRAGAAGTIGAAALKGAPADGSMLLFAPDSNISVYPHSVLLTQVTGANLNHVPYRGTVPALTDLVAGHVSAAILPMGSMIANAKSGKIRFLAQTDDDRSASLPEVPSFKELGYPMLAFSGWYGLFAPVGTPSDVVNRFNEVVVKAMRLPEVRTRMRGYELDIREMAPGEFQAMVKADTDRWGPIIRSSGFTAAAE